MITVVSPTLRTCMGQNRCSIKSCGRMVRTYQEGPRARNVGCSAEGSHTFPFHLVAKPKLVTVSFTRTDQRQRVLRTPLHNIT